MTGCLLLNKNPGISSFGSLSPVKKALQTPKVCHTGTLDSFAQGLLVILTGRAVKLSSYFTGCDKQYRALLRFGEETDTLDPEGKIIAAGPIPELKALEAALPAFTGTIQQSPPSYSAIHINGRRAYELARAGAAPEMKKRPVTIHSLSLVSWNPPYAELEVHCSSGTYIRSLARDIAAAIGSRAHLSSLVRTKVGNFLLEDAVSLSDKANKDNNNDMETIKTALKPIDAGLFSKLGIPSVYLDERQVRTVSHGGDLQQLQKVLPKLEDYCKSAYTAIALFGTAHEESSFAALIEKKEDLWKYGFVNAAN